MAKLAGQFFKRVQCILKKESVEFDPAVVAEVIQKYFPDWRRVLNELQRYSVTGKIDSGILANMQDSSIRELISLLKDKNFTEARKWVRNNNDTDMNTLYNQFYESASTYFTKGSVPVLILLIAKYQYQSVFSANQEINFVAFLVETMQELEFA